MNHLMMCGSARARLLRHVRNVMVQSWRHDPLLQSHLAESV
jgi:hypothetical protein